MKFKRTAALLLAMLMVLSFAPISLTEASAASYSNGELVNFYGGTVYRNVGSSSGAVTKDPCQVYATGQTYTYGGVLYQGMRYSATGSRYGWVKDSQLGKISYTVYFNANGGSGAPGSQTKYYNTTLTLSSTKPYRTGYNFSYWSGSTGTYYAGGSYTSNCGDTLYANWSACSYTVYFNANGGSVSTSSKTVTYGSTYGTLPTPSRSGYSFSGWYTSTSGGSCISSGTGVSITGNQTLYARWSDSQKPSASISSTNNVAASQTATLTMSDNSSLAGYYWGTSSSYSGNTYTSSSSTSASKTISASGTYYLTAKDSTGNISSTVSKTFYKTTLNANSGSVSPSSVITMSGNSFALPTPTRSGYTFIGWNTSSAGTGTSYSAGSSYKPTGNTTLYARWGDTVKPTASVDSVTNSVASSQSIYVTVKDDSGMAGYYWGKSATYTDNTFTSFSGNPTSTALKFTVTESGTYYLVIKDIFGNVSPAISKTFYKTALNANGGTVSPSYVLTLSGNSFAMPSPTYTGYTFGGWNTVKSGSGTSYAAGAAYTPSGDSTLYARWSDKEPPTAAVVSTNNLKSTQTATLELKDGVGLAGYYWGTSSTYTSNTYYSISGSPTVKEITQNITAAGTYYLTVKDTSGNVSTVTVKFYLTTFNSNGGTSSVSSVLTMAGNSFTLPTAEKTNYTIKSWNTSSAGTGTDYTAGSSYSPSASGTLYAVWADSVAPECSVSVTSKTASSQTATLTLSDNTALAGYYWGTSSVCTSNSFVSISGTPTSATATCTISAAGTYYFAARDTAGNISDAVSFTFCKVIFAANGGSVSPSSVVIQEGKTITLPTPTMSGYTFNAWNTESDSSGTAYADGVKYTVLSSTTLYASWTDSAKPSATIASTNAVASSQTVSLLMSDNVGVAGFYWGTNTAYEQNTYQTVTVGKSVKCTTSISAPGTYYLTVKDTSGNVSSQVSVSFFRTTLNAGEGTVTPAYVITRSGYSFTLPTAVLPGQTFKGWNTISDGSGTGYSEGAKYSPVSNRTLYVQWEDSSIPETSVSSTSRTSPSQTITVTIADDYGIDGYYFGKDSDYTKNSYYPVSGSPKSYTFTETISEEGTYYITAIDTSGNVSDTQSITFFKTVFNGNGGTVSVATVISREGESFTLPTATKTGYSVYAWNTKADGTGDTACLAGDGLYAAAKSQTLYAVWVDDQLPSGSLVSTNNKTDSQVVTLTLTDTAGVAGYYWGKSTVYTNNTYTAVPSALCKATATASVSESGTYYLCVLDINGNVSYPVPATFYMTTLSSFGTVSPSKVLTMSGKQFVLPGSSCDGFVFKHWSTGYSGSGTAYAAGASYSPSSSRTLYAQWYDITNPTISYTVTNSTADRQTVTLKLQDNYKVSGYYVGTNSDYENNTFISIGSSQKAADAYVTITDPGTYYFNSVDADGNVSETVSAEFTETSFEVNTDNAILDTDKVIALKGNSFALPGGEKVDYIIAEWNTEADGSGTSYKRSSSYTTQGNTTLYAVWKESIAPEGSLSSTADYAAKQTVTLTMSDNAGLAGYYWGKNSDYLRNSFTAISGSPLQKVASTKVSDYGKYYFTVMDTAGNVSETVSITFYKTTFSTAGKALNPSYYITAEGDCFTLPAAARDYYNMQKWSVNSDGTGTYYDVGATYKPTESRTLYAIFTPIVYNAEFVVDGVVMDTAAYTVETTSLNEPDVPQRAGYTCAWEDYDLVPGGITVNAIYTAIVYTAEFVADGKTIGSADYTVDSLKIDEPDVPEKRGYAGEWEDYSLDIGGITVNAVYTAIEYKVDFVGYDINKDDECIVATETYTVESPEINEPKVPSMPGNKGVWEDYSIDIGDKTVAAVYTPNLYKVNWVIDGAVMTDEYYCNQLIYKPSNPQKLGYEFTGWTPTFYGKMLDYDVTYEAMFELKTYTVDVTADGKTIASVTFTYGDEISDMDLPAVPSKAGYTGEWVLEYVDDEPVIYAKYTPITYHATFYADGRQIASVPFTVESKTIDAPAVPAKSGYIGKWSGCKITASDISVNAVYTPEYALPQFAEKTASYKTDVTIRLNLGNVPEGYTVEINGKEVETGSNGYYELHIGSLSSSCDITVRVKDGSNVVSEGKVHINVSSSFFAKLSSWFTNWLFNFFSWKKVNITF